METDSKSTVLLVFRYAGGFIQMHRNTSTAKMEFLTRIQFTQKKIYAAFNQ